MGPDDYPTRYPDNRMNCERCAERWLEENLDQCVICKRDACPYCLTWVSIKGRARDEAWCKVCLGVQGITEADFDHIPAPPEPPFVFVQRTPRSISISNLQGSVLRSRTATFIDWSEDSERRKILRKSLRILGFDLKQNGQDFKVAPAHLEKSAAVLEFTEAGIQKLTSTVGQIKPFPALEWPKRTDDDVDG